MFNYIYLLCILLFLFIHIDTVFAADTSLWFDGTNGRVLLSPNIPSLGSVFTVEAWFRWDGKKSVQYESPINRQQWGTQEWGVFLNTDTKRLGATVSYDGKHAQSGSVWLGENAQSAIVEGVWNHAAIVGTGVGGTLSLYLNGVRIDSVPQTGTPLLATIETPLVSIGGFHEGAEAEPWHGAVDEFRISTVARYSGATYQVPIGPFASDSSTVGLWHLDEGTGQTIRDNAGHGYDGQMYKGPVVTTGTWQPGVFTETVPLTDTPTSGAHRYTINDLRAVIASFSSIFSYRAVIAGYGGT